MILFVTPSERASECAAALREATGETVTVAEGLARATLCLRAENFGTVVLDQYLVETEPDEAGSTLQHMGSAILVQVNLAISGMERLVRDVQAAVQRRQRDEMRARQAAIDKLQGELNGTVTALLLSSELALQTPELPAGAMEKLALVYKLVQRLRKQLENSGTKEKCRQDVAP